MSIVRVAVIKSDKEYLVRPPLVFVLRKSPEAPADSKNAAEAPADPKVATTPAVAATPADRLRVHNYTGQALQIVASGAWPFSDSPPVGVAAKGDKTLSLKEDARGQYSYKVIVNVDVKTVEALGNSDPVIIVEDP